MTVKTRAVLNTDADSNLPDNSSQQITAEKVRQRIKDLSDSAANIESDAPFWGVRVRAASIGNITVATALATGSPSPYLDGIALAAGDLVLVKDQTAPAENGIYVVGAVPARLGRYSTFNDHPGTVVSVEEGAANADSLWRCTSDRTSGSPDPIGTTSLVFARVGRRVLTANLTIYVRADGNDANFGFVDSAGGAKLTVQAAIDLAVSFDLSLYSVDIRIGDGTYTGAVVCKSYLGVGPINLVGNVVTPANVIFSTTSNDAIAAAGVYGTYTADGMEFRTTTTGFSVRISDGSIFRLKRVRYGATAADYSQIYCDNAVIWLDNDYAITAAPSGGRHYAAWTGGQIKASAALTVTITGTPAFGIFAHADRGGILSLSGITYSGAATGTRFQVGFSSFIYTASTLTYFPGDAVGIIYPGGVYDLFKDARGSGASAYVTISAGTNTTAASHNIASVDDDGAGLIGFNIADDFSSANWAALGSAYDTSTTIARSATPNDQTAGAVDFNSVVEAGSAADPLAWSFVGIGGILTAI